MEVSSRTVMSAANETIFSPGAYFVPAHGTVPSSVRVPSPTTIRVIHASAIIFTAILYRLRTCPDCWQRCVDTFQAPYHPPATRSRLRFGLVSMNKLPAPKAGGLYKINCHQRGRFCRGLSVPFTVNVRGEPCSPGRRGQVSDQSESPAKVSDYRTPAAC